MKNLILGAAYYPEDWNEEEQEKDIIRMKNAGINTVRLAEFAWHKMEPKENEFHFKWLHKIIDKLYEAGIAVILGTPTATPPIWVEEKDPDMMILNADGVRAVHGARRNCCANNPTYRYYSERITEKMAMEFGNDKNVIGWQIDNEIIYPFGSCCCEHCKKGFQKYLEAKYGTIEALNKAWNLNLFSQNYNNFSQIPIPVVSWQNPHISYEWATFTEESLISFAHTQAEILKDYTKAPIGTDMMPIFTEDHEKMTSVLDVVQYNHYSDENDLKDQIFWFDYMRGLKDRPFWNMETSTCWNGSTSVRGDIRPEGFCRVNSWLPIILGGEANLYWLWRQHFAGHEVLHGAVLYPTGKPMHIFGEVKEVAEGYNKCSEFLLNTKVDTDIAYMVSTQSYNLMKYQAMFDSKELPDYSARVTDMYKKLIDCGIRADVVGANKDLSKYKLLFTPFLMTLEENGLNDRILEWVKNGGTWVCGPMTDIRNSLGAHYTDFGTGILEEITNASLAYQVPDFSNKGSLKLCNEDEDFKSNYWLELYDLPVDAECIAYVNDGYSTLIGKSVVFKKKYGKGTIIVLGTLLTNETAEKIAEIAVRESGTEKFKIKGDVVVSRRKGNNASGFAIAEYGGKMASIYIEEEMTDIITDKVYSNEIILNPYQLLILKK